MRSKASQQGGTEKVAVTPAAVPPIRLAHTRPSEGLAASLRSLQRTHGNRHMQRMLGAAMVQRKGVEIGKAAPGIMRKADSKKLPVPQWHQLPAYAQNDLSRSGFDQAWFNGTLTTNQDRQTALNLYVKMKGLELWKFVDQRQKDNNDGTILFQCHNVSGSGGLKETLTNRSDFSDPDKSPKAWSSRELRAAGALHFKHFSDKNDDIVEAHIDRYGLFFSPTWSAILSILFPLAIPIQMIIHGATQRSYQDELEIREMLLNQGWDAAPLLGTTLALQRQAANSQATGAVPAIVNEVLRSAGQPLDTATRAFMEPRFGQDFSRVRVHADTRAAASARAVNAFAYTVGNNIVFDTGQYDPATTAGRMLLAHELTHVVQQGEDGGFQPSGIEPADSSSEREADRVAKEVTTNQHYANLIAQNSDGLLHRQPAPPVTPAMSDEALMQVLNRYPAGEPVTLYHVDRFGGFLKKIESSGRDFVLRSSGEFWLTTNVETRTGFGGGAGLDKVVAFRVDRRFALFLAELAQTQQSAAVAERGLSFILGADIAVPRYNFEGGGKGKILPQGEFNIAIRTTSGADEMARLFRLSIQQIEHLRYDPSKAAGRRLVRVAQYYPLLPGHEKSVSVPHQSPGPAKTAQQLEQTVKSRAGQELPKTDIETPRISAREQTPARIALGSFSEEVRYIRITRLLKTVMVVLDAVSSITLMTEFTGMATSKLEGRGFMLIKEIAISTALEEQATQLLRDYQSTSQRIFELQTTLFRAAADPMNSGDLAINLWSLYTELENIAIALKEKTAKVEKAVYQVRKREEAANKILESPSATIALGVATFGTHEIARIFAAQQDLVVINGALSGAADKFHKVQSLIQTDLEFLIGWYQLMAATCKEKGPCITIKHTD